MCGIGGILHADVAHEIAEGDLGAMRDALRHRGPDGDGLFRDRACGLVHTRLAVLDVSDRARQPMLSSSGRFVLTYNGEIYNHRELREDLKSAGAEFRTSSDTEVILHLAESGGIEALDALEGMFAFALFDRKLRQIVLMRDRLGIKPLFWTADQDGIAFASEPKALRSRTARVGSGPTAAQVAEYLAFRHLADDECLIAGIRTLLPGQRLVSDGRDHRVDSWWRTERGHGANPRALEEVLERAVRRQLVSDVPVGTFLSGGVDSALVTALAAKALPRIDAFIVGFDEPGWDESSRARDAARAAGARAHEIRLSPDRYLENLGDAIWYLDAPLNHAHSVHLLVLSRFARERVTVALTGEGSDELFAGYPRYRLFRIGRLLRFLPATWSRGAADRLQRHRPRLARLLEAADPDEIEAAARNAAFVPIEEAARLAGLARPEDAMARRREILRQAVREGRDPVACLLELDRRTYLVSLLQRMDRMSMAAGLETRVPLLDEAVVDFASHLDTREKLDLAHGKKPMRRAAERRFGRAYVRAPKSGFGVPVGAWMRHGGPMEALADRILSDSRTIRRGWFDTERARRFLEEHRSGVEDRTEALWGLLNLELWARVCLDGDGPKGVPLG
jgi:asparagine synthase (glutamine-hydrolysing)